MEITKEFLDEKYGVFEKLETRLEEILSFIRDCFDKAIKEQDMSYVEGYEREYEKVENIRTAESFRLDMCKAILSAETKNGLGMKFVSKCKNTDEMLDHYVRSILYIRRLEIFDDEIVWEEAFEYLETMNFSEYAAVFIMGNEMFEHKLYLATKLYERQSANKNFDDKMKILKVFCAAFDKETAQSLLAELFLSKGDIRSAVGALRCIDTPSEETAGLINELEAFLNA